MFKGLVKIAAGIAAVQIARFLVTSIAQERQRRHAIHEHHEQARWEGEGGNPVAHAAQ